jgi:hypothetical protein
MFAVAACFGSSRFSPLLLARFTLFMRLPWQKVEQY